MSFQDRFYKQMDTFNIEVIREEPEIINENYLKAQSHLRDLGYKIKLETVTKFGVQIDLAKSYPEKDIKRDLKEYKFEIKGNTLFIKP